MLSAQLKMQFLLYTVQLVVGFIIDTYVEGATIRHMNYSVRTWKSRISSWGELRSCENHPGNSEQIHPALIAIIPTTSVDTRLPVAAEQGRVI
jgi:hypothetical protein